MKNLFAIVLVLYVCQLYVVDSRAATIQFTYNIHNKKDPFVPLVGKTSANVTYTIEDRAWKLEGIATIRGEKVAILSSEMYRVNEGKGDMVVKAIYENSVVMEIRGKRFIKKLFKEGEY